MIYRFFLIYILIVINAQAGILKVLSATSHNTIIKGTEYLSVQVTFNSPMISINKISEEDSATYFNIKPELTGKYRWLSTNTLEFLPDTHALTINTMYKLSIPKGLKSVDGEAILKEDYKWSVTTQQFQVSKESNRSRYNLKLNDPVFIKFNQDVDLERCLSFISIDPDVNFSVSYANNIEIPVRYNEYGDWEKDSSNVHLKKNIIKILPDSLWEKGKEYDINIKKGMPGLIGNLTLKDEHSFNFSTFKDLKFNYLYQHHILENENDTIYPDKSFNIEFNNYIDWENQFDKISIIPNVNKMREHYSFTTNSFSIRSYLKPQTKYRINIKKELCDIYGTKLGKDTTISFITGNYRPHAEIKEGFKIVEYNSPRCIALTSCNADSAKFSMKAISLNDIIPLLEYNSSLNDSYYSDSTIINMDSIDGKQLDIDDLANNEINVQLIRPIFLDSVLNGTPGFVLTQLVNYKSINYYTGKYIKEPDIQKSLLQVTNIGVTVKLGSKNSFVAAVKLDSGKPLGKAKLEVRDSYNKILWSGITNNKGTAFIPSNKNLISKDDTTKVNLLYLFTSFNDDCVITRLYNENNSCDISLPSSKRSSYRFKELYKSLEYKYSMFLDRGIYLPGDSVYAAGIIRYVDEKIRIPQNLKLAFKVTDSNKPIFSDTLLVSDLGSFNFKFKIPPNVRLDNYYIRGFVLNSDTNNTSKTSLIYKKFRVGEYKPEQMELSINTNKKRYVLGDTVQITLKGRYLYGTPIKNKDLNIYVDGKPNYYPIKSISGYEFTLRPMIKWKGEKYLHKFKHLPSRESILDSLGEYYTKFLLAKKLNKFGFRYLVQGTIKSEHSDISGYKEFVVHPGNYYIGLKSSKRFFPKDSSVKIDLLTVTPEENVTKVNNIKVSILKRTWVNQKGDDYDSYKDKDKTPKDSIVKELTISTDDFGNANFKFNPTEPGEYVIMAEGSNKSTASAILLYVYGKAYGRYGGYKDDIIKLQCDKANYKPGDTAKILIPSEFKECKALITIERENVFSSQWHHLNSELNIISIPIKENYLPNIYVSVLLHSKRLSELKFDDNSNDLSKPQCRIGQINLNVSPQSKAADLKIVTNKKVYSPGDSVEVTILLKDSSQHIDSKNEIIFYAVDEGVLSLTGYKTPNPFINIYNSWKHKVFTFENRKTVLDYFPKIGIPNLIRLSAPQFTKGGASLNLEKRGSLKVSSPDAQQNNNARKFFKTCAYFNPSIKLNENGKAKFKFVLPDNLTTFRLMAIIHTEAGELGSGEEKISVNKNIMINPRIPGFARHLDTISAGIIIENNTLITDTAKVSFKVTGAKLLDDSLKLDIVNKMSNKEFIFKLTPESDSDTISLYVSANKNGDHDAIQIKIPVIYDDPKIIASISGSTKSKQEESLTVPENCYKKYSNLSIDLFSTALGGLKPAIKYLEMYPYKCAEQQTSRILPYLFMDNVIEKHHLSSFKETERRKKVQDFFYELFDFEARFGGFSYWKNWAIASPYLTSYIYSAINLGYQQGYEIDQKLIENAHYYLLRMVTDTAHSKYFKELPDSWISQKAYSLSLLIESNHLNVTIPEKYKKILEMTTDSLVTGFENRSLFTQVCLLRAIRNNNKYKSIRDKIIKNIKQSIIIESSTAYFKESYANNNSWMHHSNVRTTALILKTLLDIEGECLHADKIVKWLKVQQEGKGHWRNTQDNVFALMALSEYYNKYEEVDPNFKGLVNLDNNTLIERLFNNNELNKYVNKTIPFTDLQSGKKQTLKVKKSGKGRLYYNIKLTSSPKKTIPSIDKGFRIMKSYETLEGEIINPNDFKYREAVRVIIKVYVHRDREFVVVNDPIPSGCIIVDERFNTIDRHILAAYRTKTKSRFDELVSWGTWNHYEYKKERCELYANKLNTGTHQFSYVIKPIVKGKYHVPPPYVEEMYSTETFGRGDKVTIEIK